MRLVFVCVFVTVVAASINHQHQFVILNPGIATDSDSENGNGFYTITHTSNEPLKYNGDVLTNGYTYLDTSGHDQIAAINSDAQATVPDINCAPEPVTDTPEVEMAKLAHFEAYREAALLAAIQPDTDDIINRSLESQLNEQQLAELQQNTRELLLNKQNSRYQLLSLLRHHELDRIGKELGQQQQNQLIASYILTATAEAHAHTAGQGEVHSEVRIEHPGFGTLRGLKLLKSDKLISDETEKDMAANGNGNGEENNNANGEENGNGNGNGNGSSKSNENEKSNGKDKESKNGNGDENVNVNGNGRPKGNGQSNGKKITNGNGKVIGNGNTNGNGNKMTNGNGNANARQTNNDNSLGMITPSIGNSHGNDNVNGHANSNGDGEINGRIAIPNIIHQGFGIPLSEGIDHLSSLVLHDPIDIGNQGLVDTTYYSVDTPDTHYTVVIPPSIESISLGDNGQQVPAVTSAIPVSKSFTYITQRLKSANDH